MATADTLRYFDCPGRARVMFAVGRDGLDASPEVLWWA
jgi:hypothetical protein